MLLESELDALVVDLGADLAVVWRAPCASPGDGRVVLARPPGLLSEGQPWTADGPLPAPGVVLDTPRAMSGVIPTACRLVLPAPPRAALVLPLDDRDVEFAAVIVWANGPAPPDAPGRVTAARRATLGTAVREHERVRELEVAAHVQGRVLAGLDVAVLTMDHVRMTAWLNAAAAQLLGLPEGQMPSAEVAAALARLQEAVVNAEAVREVRAGLHINPALDISGVMWHVGGAHDRHLRVSTKPLVGDPISGRVWVFDDITDEVRARHEAESAEARFRLLAENAADVVMSGSNEGIWTWVSPSVERFTGWRPDELVGTHFADVIHPDDLLRVGRLHEQGGQGRVAFDARIRQKDGAYRWISVATHPEFDEAGNVVGRFGGWRDVQPERDQWSMIADALEGMPDAGVLIFDRDMRFRIVRGGTLASTGADSSWEGQLATDVIPDDTREQVLDLYARALVGESTETEVAVADDGPVLMVRMRPLRSLGAIVGGVVLVTDVSERVAAREALRKQNEQLITVGAMQDQMIATLSHELRTPVTTLTLMLDVLSDSLPGDHPARPMLEAGFRSTARLRRMVEDVLLLAQADHGRMPLSIGSIAPDEVVSGVIIELAHWASEAGVALQVDAVPVPGAMGDEVRLAQVVLNLAGNAIKFTPAGGDVVLRVRPTDVGWMLGVKDTGIGIPADQIPRIFDPFFRASTATDATVGGVGGMGLGLAVVHQIVGEHGGRISVSSEAGVGTGIEVRFPLVPPTER